jgi:hypothetical protein
MPRTRRKSTRPRKTATIRVDTITTLVEARTFSPGRPDNLLELAVTILEKLDYLTHDLSLINPKPASGTRARLRP